MAQIARFVARMMGFVTQIAYKRRCSGVETDTHVMDKFVVFYSKHSAQGPKAAKKANDEAKYSFSILIAYRDQNKETGGKCPLLYI